MISKFKRRIKHHLRQITETIHPSWVDHPSNIQIDTHNYCNLWLHGKGCIHCNVKPAGGWNLPRGWMPTDMIHYIIRYWGSHGAESVAPYINGEPMMDARLPWICDLCQKNGMYVLVDTNGTLYRFRRRLIHPNLREVRFSFSAVTPETYEKVHGAPLYEAAEKTIKWFLRNKLPSQTARLYFITNRFNMHEIDEYIKRWEGKAWITIFPLHEVPNIQLESTKTRPTPQDYWEQITERIVGETPRQPYRPIDIYISGKRRIRHFPPYVTCQGTYSFSIAWTGQLLHCTDIPYKFNYGHIYERDMLEVWHERNKAKLGHPACSVCNVKNPRHDEILRRYLHI